MENKKFTKKRRLTFLVGGIMMRYTLRKLYKLFRWPENELNGTVPWFVIIWRAFWLLFIYITVTILWIFIAITYGIKHANVIIKKLFTWTNL